MVESIPVASRVDAAVPGSGLLSVGCGNQWICKKPARSERGCLGLVVRGGIRADWHHRGAGDSYTGVRQARSGLVQRRLLPDTRGLGEDRLALSRCRTVAGSADPAPR